MALAGRHRWYVAFHSRSDRTPCPASFGSRNCSRCVGQRNEDSKFTRRWIVISKGRRAYGSQKLQIQKWLRGEFSGRDAPSKLHRSFSWPSAIERCLCRQEK